jgi:hypothetical protein
MGESFEPVWMEEWVIILDEPNKYGNFLKLKKGAPPDVVKEFKEYVKPDEGVISMETLMKEAIEEFNLE